MRLPRKDRRIFTYSSLYSSNLRARAFSARLLLPLPPAELPAAMTPAVSLVRRKPPVRRRQASHFRKVLWTTRAAKHFSEKTKRELRKMRSPTTEAELCIAVCPKTFDASTEAADGIDGLGLRSAEVILVVMRTLYSSYWFSVLASASWMVKAERKCSGVLYAQSVAVTSAPQLIRKRAVITLGSSFDLGDKGAEVERGEEHLVRVDVRVELVPEVEVVVALQHRRHVALQLIRLRQNQTLRAENALQNDETLEEHANLIRLDGLQLGQRLALAVVVVGGQGLTRRRLGDLRQLAVLKDVRGVVYVGVTTTPTTNSSRTAALRGRELVGVSREEGIVEPGVRLEDEAVVIEAVGGGRVGGAQQLAGGDALLQRRQIGHGDDLIDHRLLGVLRGDVQRREAVVVHHEAGAVVQQQLDDVVVALLGGEVQRRGAAQRLPVNVRVRLDQQPGHLLVAHVRGEHQAGVLKVIRQVYVRRVLDQQADHPEDGDALHGRLVHHQRALHLQVGRVVLQQVLHDGGAPVEDGQHQRRQPVQTTVLRGWCSCCCCCRWMMVISRPTTRISAVLVGCRKDDRADVEVLVDECLVEALQRLHRLVGEDAVDDELAEDVQYLLVHGHFKCRQLLGGGGHCILGIVGATTVGHFAGTEGQEQQQEEEEGDEEVKKKVRQETLSEAMLLVLAWDLIWNKAWLVVKMGVA
ncbi:hypothetical protein TYRP_005907 [Tyrophagus putrescentiae]|nr:hypothetical protein TYRP_005907 [Tyrophagus putrescentiae]